VFNVAYNPLCKPTGIIIGVGEGKRLEQILIFRNSLANGRIAKTTGIWCGWAFAIKSSLKTGIAVARNKRLSSQNRMSNDSIRFWLSSIAHFAPFSPLPLAIIPPGITDFVVQPVLSAIPSPAGLSCQSAIQRAQALSQGWRDA
jgi:hypothetical protein